MNFPQAHSDYLDPDQHTSITEQSRLSAFLGPLPDVEDEAVLRSPSVAKIAVEAKLKLLQRRLVELPRLGPTRRTKYVEWYRFQNPRLARLHKRQMRILSRKIDTLEMISTWVWAMENGTIHPYDFSGYVNSL